jgi:hypothetical protein
MKQLRVNLSDEIMSGLDALVVASTDDRTYFVRAAIAEYLAKNAPVTVQESPVQVVAPVELPEEISENDPDFIEAMRQVAALRANEKRVTAEKAELDKLSDDFLNMPNMVL